MSERLFLRLLIVLLFVFVSFTEAYKVNITNFGNCDEVDRPKVNLTGVEYVFNADGLCDTIHGKYYVHTIDAGHNYELWLTVFQCATASTKQCDENERKYVEPMHCFRLHGDNTGPWYMISKAMRGSKCGEKIGELSAQLLTQYLTNYLKVEPNLSRIRLHMLFHKIGESGLDKYVRACVNVEFNIIV